MRAPHGMNHLRLGCKNSKDGNWSGNAPGSEMNMAKLQRGVKNRSQASWSQPVRDFYIAQSVKNLPAKQETQAPSLGWEDPLEEEMTTHSSIPAWRPPMERGAWQTAAHRVKSGTRLGTKPPPSITTTEPGAPEPTLRNKEMPTRRNKEPAMGVLNLKGNWSPSGF